MAEYKYKVVYDWIKENQDKAKADPGEEVSSNE